MVNLGIDMIAKGAGFLPIPGAACVASATGLVADQLLELGGITTPSSSPLSTAHLISDGANLTLTARWGSSLA